jgi:NADH-quinone oxidoreductase subunit G
MIHEAGIIFDKLKNGNFDNPLGESTGAAAIFGASGGVLEAALRTAADWITGQSLTEIDFEAVRGLEGVKEAKVKVGALTINVAVASGLGNARKLLEKIRNKEANYHAIEIMACPGGCINGGGQPYIHGNTEILQKRMEAIYAEDIGKTIRKSHENPYIIKLYEEFLGKPGSEVAHKLLHTHYTARVKY